MSATGAVGLMQVQPEVAADLGPRLVGHPVHLEDAAENADLGAAILKAYIDDQGGNVRGGLAAYYEGPGQLAAHGLAYDTADYVAGVEALMELALANGADKAIRLQVGAAFHSPLMRTVQARLGTVLGGTDMDERGRAKTRPWVRVPGLYRPGLGSQFFRVKSAVWPSSRNDRYRRIALKN